MINIPRIKVDLNELVAANLVLLSKSDEVMDSDGNRVALSAGLPISIYEYSQYENGEKEYFYAEGIVELNDPSINGNWTSAVKWCCRFDNLIETRLPVDIDSK